MTPPFRFLHPVEVRYGDLDAQRHVNHAKYFTYMELARAKYIEHLGLWQGRDFDRLGMIVAQASCDYRQAIRYGQPVRVGVRTVRLGNKSLELEYVIEDETDGAVLATGKTVMVAYDYIEGKSVPVPEDWRSRLRAFEGDALSLGS
ncbi:MAG: acyl-CoA thioesterase [Anaerolineales bacterium]